MPEPAAEGGPGRPKKPAGCPGEAKLRTRVNELIWENSKLRKEKEEALLRAQVREEVRQKEQDKELVRLRAALEKKTGLLAEAQQQAHFALRKAEDAEKELIRLREVEKLFDRLATGALAPREPPAAQPEKLASLEAKLDMLVQLQTQALLRAAEVKELCGAKHPPLLAALAEVQAQAERERAGLLELVREKEKLEGVLEGLRERLKAERKDIRPPERVRSSGTLEDRKPFLEDKAAELTAQPQGEAGPGINYHNAFGSLLEESPGAQQPGPSAGYAVNNHPFLNFGSAIEGPPAQPQPQNTFEESLLSPSPPKKSDPALKPTKIDTSKNLLNSAFSNSPKLAATSILLQPNQNASGDGLLTSTFVQQPRAPPAPANAIAGPFNIVQEPVSFSDSEDIGAKRVVSRFGTIVPNRESQNQREAKELRELKDKYEQVLEENRRLLEAQQKPPEPKAPEPEPEAKAVRRETRERDSEDDSGRHRFTRLDYFGERPSIPSAKLNFVSINDDKKKEQAPKKEPVDFSLEERRKTQVDLKDFTSIYSFQPPQEMISALTNYVNSVEPRAAAAARQPPFKPESFKDSDVDFDPRPKLAVGKPPAELDSLQAASQDAPPDAARLQVQNKTVSLPSVKNAQECVSAFYSTYPIAEQPENEELLRSSRADTGKFGEAQTPKLGAGFAQRQFSFKESPPQSMQPKDPSFGSSGLAERPRLDSMAREITDMKKVIEEEREQREKIAAIVREKDDEVRALRQQLEHMQSSSREQNELSAGLSKGSPVREDAKARPRPLDDRETGEEHDAQDEGNSYKTSGTVKDKKKSLANSSARASFQSQDNRLSASLQNRRSLPTSQPEELQQATSARQPRSREDAGRQEEEAAEKSPKSRSSSRVRTVEEISTVYRTQVKTTVDESFQG